ncbi:MAG: hypothetical protein JXL97_06025 [Bacteroidales bacterium]|nr:hypothetical protein [Bacteroidales bacterium]
MENQVYYWLVKNGNIQIQKNEDCISLQLDYENGECCLLTRSDTNEIIGLLTSISKEIWEDPNYQRKPHINHLLKYTENGYYWEIETSQIIITYNEIEDAIEIKYNGNSKMNLEINYVVKIIQILEHFTLSKY